MIDTNTYYAKLACGEPITEDEIEKLLKAFKHFHDGALYLAECQAATAEGMNKSTSKSERRRQVELCKTAAGILDGDRSRIRSVRSREVVIKRCMDVIESESNSGGAK
jgi:hypothetical protein